MQLPRLAAVPTAFALALAITGIVRAAEPTTRPTTVPATAPSADGHYPPVRTVTDPKKKPKGWLWEARKEGAIRIESPKIHNCFFVGEPVEFKLGPSAKTYEIRDYWGEIVDKGPAGEIIKPNVTQPGWYKLYVFGEPYEKAWGDVVGGTMFSIFREDKRFPDLPSRAEFKPASSSRDGMGGGQLMRAITGMGPQRHSAGASMEPGKPDKDGKATPSEVERSIAGLKGVLEIDRTLYLPYDPIRKRKVMIAFPNGTRGREEGVKAFARAYKDVVTYYEPRNEPNFKPHGDQEKWTAERFVNEEMKPFYEAVKSVDPNLKVMGPGTVSIGPDGSGQGFIEDFLKAGGGKYIDVFSFHNYNMACGDLSMLRRSMSELRALLDKYDLKNIEIWQTEQGFAACSYGTYVPRIQGRWTMLEIMAFEQYGLPKEQNHWWYDASHGFWDVPHWWINDDGSMNPAGPLFRVYSEEVFGKTFSQALDFGPAGNNAYLGNVFTGADGAVAAIMTAGATDGKADLKVTGAQKLTISSAFGVVTEVPVSNGVATIAVPEIPVYVRLPKGVSITVVPMDYGPNLARVEGVEVKQSGTGRHPSAVKKNPDGSVKEIVEINNSPSKLFNGELEHWLWGHKDDNSYWYNDDTKTPSWVEIKLPQAEEVARINIYCPTPDRWWGNMRDYEIQYMPAGKSADGDWVTIEHVNEPAKTVHLFTPTARTAVDQFYSERHIFFHQFKPVKTDRFRILMHAGTYGYAADEVVNREGPWEVTPMMQIREIEIYGK